MAANDDFAADEPAIEERSLVADAGAPDDPDLPLPTLPLDPLLVTRAVSAAETTAAAWVDVDAAARRHYEQVAARAARHPRRRRVAWMDLPLAELRYCVVDLETTGTHAGAEIIEIGAVRVEDQTLADEFSTCVRPWGPMEPAAQAVHNIDPRLLADAPRLQAVLPAWLEHARGCVLVFHNAGFDLGFLQAALRDDERPLLAGPLLDTLTLARRLLGGRCGLGAAARRLAIPGAHLHRALPDARLTAKLLVAFLDALTRAGVERLGDVPGATTCARRIRRPGAAPRGAVARRLEAAQLHGETLHIACRLGAGLAPLELRIQPQLVQSGLCTALDLDRGAVVQIDIARIESIVRI